MADIDFPALPNPAGGSFSESEVPSWVEDRGEVGPPRRRNRFTRSLESFSFALQLTNAQKEILMDFYQADLARGVKAFNWTHPTTQKVHEVQFVQRPQPTHLSGSIDLWEVAISLQEI